ncbi:hypothetical protein H1D32_22905 [Anaerobacillus sp. CMMVII]|uniref:hypothetical protein n=1 Tax=Anaerobacillus sp. CMMVII TaxID=2755588 RepID=UPI0021B79917|nr:hypothetical protein [Anaerobacillus sp. CMMVII]MCT8140295.1 hypothetical protein [Anaerobacillus sp. CMMVII]
MKKYLFRSIFVLLIVLGIFFLFIELTKEEIFTIVRKESETSVWIESNKLINPSYKRATLGLKYVDIVNEFGEVIDYRELGIGDKIKADLKPLAFLSDPPGLSAWKITLLK